MNSPDTPSADATPRRHLIGAGLVGLAGSLLPVWASRANASPAGAAPTTTAPPKRPTNDDISLLGFAQSVELAAEHLFRSAIDGGALGDDARAVVDFVRDAHEAHSDSISALLGVPAPRSALESAIASFGDGFSSSSESDVLAAAHELENVAVATHVQLIGRLVGVDGASLAASILMAESRFAVVFADLAGHGDIDAVLVNSAEALTPEAG